MKSNYYLASLTLCAIVPTALAQSLNDSSLEVQTVVSGLENPTGVVFLPDGDEFVILKDSGQVKLIHNGAATSTPLDLNVANDSERGLLGIALHPQFARNGFVYLYYTAAHTDGGDSIGNRIERYHWNGSALAFDRRIKNLPGGPGPNHDGGKITFGPDGKLYAVIGNLNRDERTENFEDSSSLSLSGVILRLNSNGTSPTDNPFYSRANVHSSKSVLNDIYAYGVRNSFGMTFDSTTGQLWDTENGPELYDEINRVTPGFNSGWQDIMGPRSRNGGTTGKLVKLGKKAHYNDPLFSWKSTVAPTDLAFNNSDLLGNNYHGDLFIGDDNTGRIYDFDLTTNRKDLTLSGGLADRVADNSNEQSSLIFGSGFGVVTSIVPRSDGLYVLSLSNGELYRITETGSPGRIAEFSSAIAPEPTGLVILGVSMCFLSRRRPAVRKRL